MTASKPNCLLKDLLLNIITLVVRASMYGLWGGHNIQSTTHSHVITIRSRYKMLPALQKEAIPLMSLFTLHRLFIVNLYHHRFTLPLLELYVIFCVWLLSHNIFSVNTVHIYCTYQKSVQCSIVWIYHSFSYHPIVGGHQGHFQSEIIIYEEF